MIHTQLTPAMTQEKFNLQWREFKQSAEQTIKDLFSDDYFTDVTLVSHDEKQIQAHKVILCGASWACLPSSFHSKIQQYCGPNGPTASIFYGIWIKQSCAMGFILNLDKVLPKKLFPTMNI